MASKLTSFLRRVMGSADSEETESERGTAVEHNGYTIHPAARKQGSQWLTAGVITKTFDDGVKEHSFIRADVYAAKEDAESCAITKGKRIIDEQGDRMFGEG
ncbi:MAG: HlyU family transcriptional regulator [Kiloniellales bacterium]